jgi:branched-chain amino acid transport system substrate-binding protein
MFLLSLFVLTACSTAEPSSDDSNQNNQQGSVDPIVLGASVSISGPSSILGESFKKTFDLALEELNANGGVNDREVKIIYYDDGNNPDEAVKNAVKLINQDKVNIILGPSTSQTAAAVQPIADERKVLMWSTSGTYQAPSDSYGFSVSYKMVNLLGLLHDYYKQQGMKKIGVIATTDVSGNISVNQIETVYNGKDGIEYVIERMGPGDVEATPQLTRLKSKEIDGLLNLGIANAAATVLQNLSVMNYDIPVFMTHVNHSYSFANAIKDFVPEELYFAGYGLFNVSELSDDNPLKDRAENLIAIFEKKYGEKMEPLSAAFYDQALILFEVLKMAGTDDATKVKETLETQIKEFPGTHAVFTFTKEDHQGTGKDGITLMQLHPDLSWHVKWEPKFWEN